MSAVAAYTNTLVEGIVDHGTQAALSFDPSTEQWARSALDAIETLASEGLEFTSDDLYWRVGQPPSPNCMGAVIRAAARAGVIRAVGWRPTHRIPARGRTLRVWVGAP